MWSPAIATLTSGLFLLAPSAIASPLKAAEGARLVINADFPDPSFVETPEGIWYAFGTNSKDKKVQVASSKDFETWTVLDIDALPNVAPWETEKDHWAPDVIRRNDGKYVLYYSGEAKALLDHHCVGSAVSVDTDPAGPYIPTETPLSCPLDQGGSIDPAGFQDVDGSRYVVYKVDGNSIGNGGDCNNGIEPKKPTPIMLQRVAEDGITVIGGPVEILDRDDTDGPLVEAPNLIFKDDTYYLFYSTHCFTDPNYDVRYATSKSLMGPYVKTNERLLKTGDWGLISPGGGTVCPCGDRMLFHGFCEEHKRCTYVAQVSLSDGKVALL
ncbi:glycoside hydrolase family 43 protein [Aspergillus candidus]|uniref:Arabinanase/levansucrase/invertase n=1 Tax=Aspergillus candidus TaxID=41067 RepID=A0A2I2FE67_ASPCN|nr:Arabinanase/levansucrase/invertase [Aspergillus candidus]PLB38905.1 Arabinanase/levansucrase/invertase [Aspergillus candidus]